MIGAIIAPIFVLLFIFIWISAMVPSCSLFEVETTAGTPEYSADAIGDYADEQYAAAFGMTDDYEDHMLLVFLADEECYDYYYIAWVGDHIERDVAELFGDNQTALGRALAASVNAQSYEYSLDSDLASVFKYMAEQVTSLGHESNLTCTAPDAGVSSHLVNHTALPLTEETVNTALEAFTAQTGITVVVAVEDMTDVLGGGDHTEPQGVGVSPMLIIPVVVVIAIVIVMIVRSKKSGQGGEKKDQWSD